MSSVYNKFGIIPYPYIINESKFDLIIQKYNNYLMKKYENKMKINYNTYKNIIENLEAALKLGWEYIDPKIKGHPKLKWVTTIL